MTVAKRDRKSITPAWLCGVLWRVRQSSVNEEVIREALGDASVATHAAVGRVFGQSANTIKQSWASTGMPGRQGHYVLADILIWRLRYEAALAERTTSKPKEPHTAEARKEKAEARKIELQVEKLELEMAETIGRLVDRDVAGTAFRAILSEVSEALATIGDELEPEFPLEIAKEKVATINRMHARILKAAAEKGARVVSPSRVA